MSSFCVLTAALCSCVAPTLSDYFVHVHFEYIHASSKSLTSEFWPRLAFINSMKSFRESGVAWEIVQRANQGTLVGLPQSTLAAMVAASDWRGKPRC